MYSGPAQWQRLSEVDNNYRYSRGSLFLFKAEWPFEEFVQFVLVVDGTTYRFVSLTGYKSGHIYSYLPGDEEGFGIPGLAGIRAGWLKENWNKWVYPDGNIEDVYAVDGYPVPKYPPSVGVDIADI
ncbi:Imm45 family immunity protein [uncultured Sphingomonas sp.]|uniref:Imm45 family immunity protein n=1 Tax=uncultured Sphingomonas sp. TaxID=158754 RepID=UPI0025EE767E|nr:Imm45 family immunity protein [uncultured Sphingomonas sp.]